MTKEQATNEPKWKVGDDVYHIFYPLDKSSTMSIEKREIYAIYPDNPDGYYQTILAMHIKHHPQNGLFTKEQALLAFQEWLGKE